MRVLMLLFAFFVVPVSAYCQKSRTMTFPQAIVTQRTQNLLKVAKVYPDQIQTPVRVILELRDQITSSDLLNWEPDEEPQTLELTKTRKKEIDNLLRKSQRSINLTFVRIQPFKPEGKTYDRFALFYSSNDLKSLGATVEYLTTVHPSIERVQVEQKINATQVPDIPDSSLFQRDYRKVTVSSRKGAETLAQFMQSRANQDSIQLISRSSDHIVVSCTPSGLRKMNQALAGMTDHIEITRPDFDSENPLSLQKYRVFRKGRSGKELSRILGQSGIAVPIVDQTGNSLTVLATVPVAERITAAISDCSVSRIPE